MIHNRVCDSYSDFYDTKRDLCVIDAMQKGFSRSNLLYMIRSAEVYPEKIVHALSGQLTNEYESSFKEKNLRRMIQFAEVFPDKQIVVSLTRQLSWTHFITLIPLKDSIQRDFYAEKSYEHVKLLRLGESGTHIAEYLTDLPPIHVLEAKLHEAIPMAREQIAACEVPRLEGAK